MLFWFHTIDCWLIYITIQRAHGAATLSRSKANTPSVARQLNSGLQPGLKGPAWQQASMALCFRGKIRHCYLKKTEIFTTQLVPILLVKKETDPRCLQISCKMGRSVNALKHTLHPSKTNLGFYCAIFEQAQLSNTEHWSCFSVTYSTKLYLYI